MNLFIKKYSLALMMVFCLIPFGAKAQDLNYSEDFFKAQVINVLSEGEVQSDFFAEGQFSQQLSVQLLQGVNKDQIFEATYINPTINNKPYLLARGDLVVLVKTEFDNQIKYEVFEPYRLSALFWLTIVFILIAILIAGKKGFTSLLGLGATLVILIGWMVPSIVGGQNPFMVSMIGVLLIAGFSFYLSHGFNRRTTMALLSTLFTLGISAIMALVAVSFSRLFGLGSEEAASLGITFIEAIDLRGLLLGAIVIGSLGVLDDITTAQVAIVEELKRANHKYQFRHLYQRSMVVGRAHITSLINTLVIAYVGASMPVFLLFTVSKQPLWVILNNEFLAEEIVRTLVGSATLIVSVPITTLLAAWYYSKYPHRVSKEAVIHCGHTH